MRRRNAQAIRIDCGRKPGADLIQPADHPVLRRNNNISLGMVFRCECVDDCLHRRMLLVAGMRQSGLGPVKRLRGRVDGHCNAHALHLAEGVEAKIVRAADYDLAGRRYGLGGRVCYIADGEARTVVGVLGWDVFDGECAVDWLASCRGLIDVLGHHQRHGLKCSRLFGDG